VTGACDPSAASIFGWSAALFIDLAIQASHTGDGRSTRRPPGGDHDTVR
jgi:hypothetical protein